MITLEVEGGSCYDKLSLNQIAGWFSAFVYLPYSIRSLPILRSKLWIDRAESIKVVQQQPVVQSERQVQITGCEVYSHLLGVTSRR